MATLKSIAEECGVSIATVSMVLNGKADRISNETIQLVLETARKQNYVKNQLASGLISKETHTYGLILPDIRNDYFASLGAEINLAMNRINKTLLLCNSNNNGQQEIKLLRQLLGYYVDGIIMVSTANHDEDSIKELHFVISGAMAPIIFLDRKPHRSEYSYFASDNFKGGYLATKHLLNLGHRKIGHLSGPMSLVSSAERLKGYKAALREYKIKYDPQLIFEGDFELQSGLSSLVYFLSVGVTAIFSANDMMAYGLTMAAHENNILIPDSMSIVGFDNNTISEACYPPLTTISQDLSNMCLDSVAYLQELKSKQTSKANKKQLYDPKLVVRSSTMPPGIGLDT